TICVSFILLRSIFSGENAIVTFISLPENTSVPEAPNDRLLLTILPSAPLVLLTSILIVAVPPFSRIMCFCGDEMSNGMGTFLSTMPILFVVNSVNQSLFSSVGSADMVRALARYAIAGSRVGTSYSVSVGPEKLRKAILLPLCSLNHTPSCSDQTRASKEGCSRE